ncbi:MAG: caspase family protein [Planctomycetaceae bacterium]|jgi:hypothetical protein|nr:caspase family protein [Planctomycetaceae bacterium]
MKRLIFAFLLLWTVSSAAFAENIFEKPFKCLFVSIEKYENAPLDFADNDLEKFVSLLTTRYNCQAEACIDRVQSKTYTGDAAAQISIMDKIEGWCGRIGENDTALLYLSGHGVKDDDGKLYLAMTNFNQKNFDTAAIPLEWIREKFEECEGKSKLLLIDTCFAGTSTGTSKSIGFEQVNSGDVSGSFADMKNVVTIASCRENEKSYLWGEAKHSLFTYWFIEALKGHADDDGDRIITCGELVAYLQDKVSWVADSVLSQKQHPVVLNEAAGANFKLPLYVNTLSGLIDDAAEQIDVQMRINKKQRIGIPEFYTGSEKDPTFDEKYGALPHKIAEDLRKALAKKARQNGSNYAILTDNALRDTLKSKGITSPSDLGTEKTKNMKINGTNDDIPVLVDGRLSIPGSTGSISLHVKLVDTATQGGGEYEVSGAALLNSSELAMSGISGKFVISTPPPPTGALTLEPGVGLASESQLAEVQRMTAAAEAPHPLSNPANSNTPDGKFDVWIETRPIGRGTYKKRAFTHKGNDCYLELNKGEEYQIQFKADSSDDIFVRILVDGLNTLSQPPTARTRGAYVEAADSDSESDSIVAPRVSLETARPWVVLGGSKNVSFSVPGFFDVNGKPTSDTVRRFKIVDLEEAVAAKKKYSEQIGLITVAFYNAVDPPSDATPPTTRGAVGTGMGAAERTNVKRYERDKVPGDLLAVYNIRYMTPEMLKQTVPTR